MYRHFLFCAYSIVICLKHFSHIKDQINFKKTDQFLIESILITSLINHFLNTHLKIKIILNHYFFGVTGRAK